MATTLFHIRPLSPSEEDRFIWDMATPGYTFYFDEATAAYDSLGMAWANTVSKGGETLVFQMTVAPGIRVLEGSVTGAVVFQRNTMFKIDGASQKGATRLCVGELRKTVVDDGQMWAPFGALRD